MCRLAALRDVWRDSLTYRLRAARGKRWRRDWKTFFFHSHRVSVFFIHKKSPRSIGEESNFSIRSFRFFNLFLNALFRRADYPFISSWPASCGARASSASYRWPGDFDLARTSARAKALWLIPTAYRKLWWVRAAGETKTSWTAAKGAVCRTSGLSCPLRVCWRDLGISGRTSLQKNINLLGHATLEVQISAGVENRPAVGKLRTAHHGHEFVRSTVDNKSEDGHCYESSGEWFH